MENRKEATDNIAELVSNILHASSFITMYELAKDLGINEKQLEDQIPVFKELCAQSVVAFMDIIEKGKVKLGDEGGLIGQLYPLFGLYLNRVEGREYPYLTKVIKKIMEYEEK